MGTKRQRTGDIPYPPSLAARQHGLLKHSQLLAAGLTRQGISKRVARGALTRRHRGVYSLAPGPLSREAQFLAAVFAAGVGAALSHLAAAELWKIWRYYASRMTVVVPSRRTVRDVDVHRCAALDPRDVTTHRGIPVTTVARTCVDLTDVLIVEELTNVIHEAAYRRRFSIPAARDAMARANGRHNLDVLEDAITLWLKGSAGLKSRLEKSFLALMVSAGLPKPLPNVHVEGLEVDAHWPGTKLIVELDGPNHMRPPTARADALSDRILTAAGYTVLRFSELEVEQRPAGVVAAVTASIG